MTEQCRLCNNATAKGYLHGVPCCRVCGMVPDLDELGEFTPDDEVLRAMRFADYECELRCKDGSWWAAVSSHRSLSFGVHAIYGNAHESTPGEALAVACRRYKAEVARYIQESKVRNEEV